MMPSQRAFHPAFAQATVFAGLSDDDLEAIASRFSRRPVAKGAYLCREGEPAGIYYLVGEGQVKVIQTSVDGFEVILHLMGAGEIVGALPTLGEDTYPASVVALTRVLAFAVSPLDFEDILRHHPAATLNLMRFAVSRLQAANARLREMATERVEQRIARTLARLSSQMGQRTADGIVLDTPLSRQDLAEMTGTTLFTVSRTLKAWERRGILRARRKQIVITNPHALVAIGEDLPNSKHPSSHSTQS